VDGNEDMLGVIPHTHFFSSAQRVNLNDTWIPLYLLKAYLLCERRGVVFMSSSPFGS